MKTNKELTRYNLYNKFLGKYQPYYNIFYLTQLFDIVREHKLCNALEIRRRWQQHFRNVKMNKVTADTNLYIHVPFCQFKCEYCMYYSKIEFPYQHETEKYVNRLIKQMEFFKGTFSGFKFRSLYIGGGTPSIFTEKQMERLLGSLFGSFKFENEGEMTYECNPQSVTLSKLKLIKRFGFNRVSFGVESLDAKVLRFANRSYQTYRRIETVVKNAQQIGLEVNLDLMAGLKGDSIKTIINDFIALAKLKPYSLTIYPHKPSERYLKKFFQCDYYTYANRIERRMVKVRKRLKQIGKKKNFYIDNDVDHGNEIASASEPSFYFEESGPSNKYRYDFNRLEPCSLFSLGPCACSYIFNLTRYKDISTGQEGSSFDAKAKAYSVVDFDPKDQMRYYILHFFSWRWGVSKKGFRDFFNLDLEDNFRDAIDSLKKLGKVEIDSDSISLPSHPHDRYACGLFFFNREKVIKKINYFFSKILLKIIIEKKEFLIQIERIRKNKRYYFISGNFGFYFNIPKGKLNFSEVEKRYIKSFCALFKAIALNNSTKSAESLRDLLFKNIRKVSDSKKYFSGKEKVFKVSIQNALSKNEKHLF